MVAAESSRGGSSRLMSPTSVQVPPPSAELATPRERSPREARSAMYLQQPGQQQQGQQRGSASEAKIEM